MEDLRDQIIIIEHQAMYNSHVLAQVTKMTEKKIRVIYWDVREENWNMDPVGSVRSKHHIVNVLGDTKLFTPEKCQKIAMWLKDLRDGLRNEIQIKTAEYNKKVKDFTYDT